jgi:hypothetical protein
MGYRAREARISVVVSQNYSAIVLTLKYLRSPRLDPQYHKTTSQEEATI